MIPHRQGNRQSPLLANRSSNLVRASSTGNVGMITVVGVVVGESVGTGMNEDVGAMLLVGRIEISGDGVAKLSVECTQPETITMRSIK